MKSWLKFFGVCEPSRLAILQKSTQVLCTVAMALMLGKDVYFFDVSLEDASSHLLPTALCEVFHGHCLRNPMLPVSMVMGQSVSAGRLDDPKGDYHIKCLQPGRSLVRGYPAGHSNPVAIQSVGQIWSAELPLSL